MSNEDPTKLIPTEDKIDSLINLVRQVVTDVGEIKTRLTTLEQKVDARLHETRPIWEGVLARLEELEIMLVVGGTKWQVYLRPGLGGKGDE